MNMMHDLSFAYHLSFEICGVAFCIICLFMLTGIRYYNVKRANYLTVFLIGCVVLGVNEILALYFRGNTTRAGYFIVRVTNFSVFLLIYFLTGLCIFYLRRMILDAFPEKTDKRAVSERLYYVAYIGAGLCVIGAVLLLLSQFINIFYAFDDSNSFYRLQPSFLQQLIPGFAGVISAVAILPYIKYLSIPDRVSIIVSAAMLVILAALTIMNNGLSIGSIGAQGVGIVWFAGYMRTSAEHGRRREQIIKAKDAAIAEQRARVMQNQIRPHFIFNSLLAIKQLCIESPVQAADALQHFSSFLRTNLEAMTDEEPVPVLKEIECIKEYVALEQADPANRFTVKYDIEFMDFKVPLLSIEPMVENAIRHGIASRRGNGEVIITTKKEGDNAVIIVEDNGSGFGSETAQQAHHRSLGVQNSRDRIELVCGGALSIVNTGAGTIVRIVIPLDKNGLEEHGLVTGEYTKETSYEE